VGARDGAAVRHKKAAGGGLVESRSRPGAARKSSLHRARASLITPITPSSGLYELTKESTTVYITTEVSPAQMWAAQRNSTGLFSRSPNRWI